jgi:hypothetical protein
MNEVLKAAGIHPEMILGAKGARISVAGKIEVISPINGERLAEIACVSREEYDQLVESSVKVTPLSVGADTRPQTACRRGTRRTSPRTRRE